ncbi:MAG: Eco57I restriction-modification methylase domain-containing protein [Prevotella sp.]|nr:Eco57I restriction-modification methylase domain-containing protein [Prevotella sp.]
MDRTLLDGLIVGRVEPYIYAFTTERVPNYLKVGDTSRGVRVRLDEWRKTFPNLVKRYEHSAQIDEETIFRDYSVHGFLEKEKGRERLLPDTINDLHYYSNEFFKEATTADLDEAISDIHQSFINKDGKYRFYSPDRSPQIYTYERKETFAPRDNQQQVIDNFKAAVAAGRTNLLLYAVMRFGKSFTAMCCAKEMDAKVVVIVSAKADVEEEWKKTVESHVYFAGYKFLNGNSLRRSETIIADTFATEEKVVLFLTLQDLQGEKIKAKHKEVFERQIDLLIIDETHFGARADSYGKVLQEQKIKKTEIDSELKSLDGFETLDKVEDAVKVFKAKIKIHLSGTPYRILMSDEFRKEDIIAFVQFTDIIDAQKQWDEEHLKEDEYDEWDNPYYGFPQMIRFAFNPNASSIKKMEELRKSGITYAFSELFRPYSMISNAGGSHRQFIHEAEILDLLEVIDGSKEDENLLGFLDYDKIKAGKMCRHIVMVLPYRSSCDAMAALICREKKRFKNLNEYEIINIAGFDDIKKYKQTDDVKRIIKACEEKNCKTLTLTVNRMLTGTTVPQWDTMIYLKGTASPQEYDQAIFRLQNQYVKIYKDENGKTFKYNMKPQTLLVDFDPNRMFRLQELKSQLYNVNTEVQGNVQLKERIAKELSVSPIIILNKNRLQEVTPNNITDAVREYSRNRSIKDEASDIPADNLLLNDAEILKVIQGIAPIDAKNGLQIKPSEGEGDDYNNPDEPAGQQKDDAKQENDNNPQPEQPQEVEDDKLGKRLAAYYARVLFFAFLTESTVKSLEEVISAIKATEDNRRIAKNLGLDINILNIIQEKSNPFILQKLDYKIENTNDLIRDAALQPIERVEVAMRKFGRLSDSEIVTPAKVADEMVAILPFEELDNKEDAKFLDIASKQGEYSIALYKKFGEKVKARLYAIPTSTLAYEFTRKIYTLLGMSIENIFSDFNSYDLIGENNEKIIKQLKDMKFDTILGNPPYQRNDGGGMGSSAPAIYNYFVDAARNLSTQYICIITPSRWFTGGRGLDEFRDNMLNDNHVRILHDYPDASDCFPGVEIKGGVSYFLRNCFEDGLCTVVTHKGNNINMVERPMREQNAEVFIRDSRIIDILRKVQKLNEQSFSDIISANDPFGYDIRENNSYKRVKPDFSLAPFDGSIEFYYNGWRKNGVGYIKRETVRKNVEWIDYYKVLIPKAWGVGDSKTDWITPFIVEPGSCCTETYLVIGPYENKKVAENIVSYMQTKLFHLLVSIVKITQNAMQKAYSFVPMQDFSKPWTDAELYKKYGLTDDEIVFIESMIKSV